MQPVRILELGVGDLTRSVRSIAMAQRFHDGPESGVQYCGIDLFEARAEGAIKLKDAHQQLKQTGAKTRLVPGELMSAVARTANILSAIDLLIIDSVYSGDEVEAIFPFLPRLLHDGSSIARYDLQNGKLRLRWMKPDSFVRAGREAA